MKRSFQSLLLSTLITLVCVGLPATGAMAFPFTEIAAYVNPATSTALDNNDGTWDIRLDYSFKVTNDAGSGAEMNYLSLEFEKDVFVSVNSFYVTDPTNWDVSSMSSGTSLYELSSAGDTIGEGEWLTATANVTMFGWAMNNVSDPVNVQHSWDEGQIWAQSVFSRDTLGGGDGTSTAPVPEPATMLLLGIGLIGFAGVSRKKIFKKK